MGRPIWQLLNSNLGTITENVFYEYQLEAIDEDASPVTYTLIAGTLPTGIQLTGTTLSGVPIKVSGVPANVPVDTSTAFSIRATSTTLHISDVTLDLTVSGQKIPIITTTSGLLATAFYGDYIDIQLDAVDEDIGNVLTWKVINNGLPTGLNLTVDSTNDRIAYIRGYPIPVSVLPAAYSPGFDDSAFDAVPAPYGFDFTFDSVDQTVAFNVTVSDGIGFDSKSFSVLLRSNITLTADNSVITVDTSEQTADTTFDSTARISPIITNTVTDLGTHLHNNYFTFKFTGLDFEDDPILINEYKSGAVVPPLDAASDLPSGLQINPVTGWLYGIIGTQSGVSGTYTFTVGSAKTAATTIKSAPKTFTITIKSDLSDTLVWSTPSNMLINNGDISKLILEATPTFTTTLVYSLKSGNLPVGMAMTSTGLITGRPSFSHFILDSETTLSDGTNGVSATTFDNTFTFTVNVIDTAQGIINEDKIFTITVSPINSKPYEALYMVSNPSVAQQLYYNTLITDSSIIPAASVYRQQDSAFGISSELKFLLAEGLAASSLAAYKTAMSKNHSTTQFGFSTLKTARATDASGTVIYEVIYAEVIDKFTNNNTSVSSEVSVNGVTTSDLTVRVPAATPVYNASGGIVVHPASIKNMRSRMISQLTQSNPNTLPDWMTSTQSGGNVLGFIPAVPIVYCLPGKAEKVLFDIDNSGFDLNKINFEVDRYIWDNNMTTEYNEIYFDLADRIANGTFLSNTVNWTALYSTLSATGSYLTITNVGGAGNGLARQTISTVTGSTYQLTFDTLLSSSGETVTAHISDGTTSAYGASYANVAAVANNSTGFLEFTAVSAATSIIIIVNGSSTATDYVQVDNIVVLGPPTQLDFDNVAPNGTFVGGDGAGGTAYVVNDTITLPNSTIVTVNAVDGNGDITAFSITSIGLPTTKDVALAQVTTSGTGTGFTITPTKKAAYYMFFGLTDTHLGFDGVAPNGSFVGGDGAGGTAYVVNDTITLPNGTVLNVVAIDGNGNVTEFSITVIGSLIESNATLSQTSTSGSGTGFTITPIRQTANFGDSYLKFPLTNVFQ